PIVPTQPAKAIAAGAGDFIPMKGISLDTEISWPCELLLGLGKGERKQEENHLQNYQQGLA
ncbi:MAG: hypothetical protein OXG84_05685, partial [Chloroflexi bacterium]|nr:hypothetical protein [Chloroflexota bacterium]